MIWASSHSLRVVVSWAVAHDFAPGASHFSPLIPVGWLWRVESGALQVRIGENSSPIRVEQGQWLWHPPCQERWLHAERMGARWHTVGISANVGAIDGFVPPAPLIWTSQNDARGAALMELLCQTREGDLLANEGLPLALCAWLWQEKAPPSPRKIAPFLNECLQKIERQPGVSVSELARMVHFSPSQFRRIWEEQLGVSPREYLMSYRLGAARFELQNGDDSLEIIAHKCGFSGAAQLARLWRSRFGVSPLAWRKLLREKE